MAVINWNGSVSPCCAVWEETYDFGNMFNSSFKTIWNGSMYRASRRVVSGKAIPEDDQMDLICARCKLNGFVDH
jgi:radical SAM protein with 4Fe4S-binding SPASM domain